ncbi:MAG TPA: hypothetical protein VK934_13265 [Fimbriimonas sp.]|nr:hypothetical protein [Fimbriimonas sp.]
MLALSQGCSYPFWQFAQPGERISRRTEIDATEGLIKLLKRTPNNRSFLDSVVQKTRATV